MRSSLIRAWRPFTTPSTGAVTTSISTWASPKSKDQAAGVRWVHGDATTLPPAGGDLAVMTGNLPFVSFRYTYWFASDGALITSDSTLRFRSREEVESSLAACGYRVAEIRDAPDRPGREFVFIAERLPRQPRA